MSRIRQEFIKPSNKQSWKIMNMRSLALRSMGEVQVHKRSPTHGTCKTLFGKLPPQKGMVWLVPSSQSNKIAHTTNVDAASPCTVLHRPHLIFPSTLPQYPEILAHQKQPILSYLEPPIYHIGKKHIWAIFPINRCD